MKTTTRSNQGGRMILVVSACGVFCLAASMTVRADTYPRQPDVDAIHYVFTLTLGDASPEISGSAALEMRFVKDGVRSFELDLASAANAKGMSVTEVSSMAGAVTY